MRSCVRVRWSTALRWIAVMMISLVLTGTPSLRVAHATAAGSGIATVTFGGNASNPAITVNGSDFGASAPSVVATGGCGGFGGDDYGYYHFALFDMANNPNAFDAGFSNATLGRQSCIGLVIDSYSDTQVAYHFSSYYTSQSLPAFYALKQGDPVWLFVNGHSCSVNVNYGATVTCPSPTVSSVAFSGNASSPTITVNGSGFGTSAPPAEITSGCNSSGGADYGYLHLALFDMANNPNAFNAGFDNPTVSPEQASCILLVLQSYTDTQVVYNFSSYYTGFAYPSNIYVLNQGDPFWAFVAGAGCAGSVSYGSTVSCGPTISSVSIAGSATAPTITINGFGFGTSAPPQLGGVLCGATDYATQLHFLDANTWSAGFYDPTQQRRDCIGLTISSYSDSQIVYTFQGFYGSAPYTLLPFSSFTVYVGSASCSGTVLYPSTTTCRAPYSFSGFFAPVDNQPTVNLVKAGQAVPIQFSLGGNQGLSIFAGTPTLQQTSCASGATDNIVPTTTAGNSSLSYNSSTNTYTYVWKTDSSWAGTCGTLHVVLNDGSDHTALFQFK